MTRFKQGLMERGIGAAIITNPVNIFYLTGFRGVSQTEREAVLIAGSSSTLITARLYQNEARALVSKNLKAAIAAERNGLFKKIAGLLKNIKSVGFEEDDLKYGEYKKLEKAINTQGPAIRLVPCKNLVENIRVIKTREEIAKIEKAQEISQKAFGQIIKTIKAGQSEAEIEEKLALIIKACGADGLAFESIIAAGPNSAKPHHKTSDRRLSLNDMLLVDFGAKYQGYCGDLSRTVFIGHASDRYKNIFQHVKKAQKKAIDKIAGGIKPQEIHHAAKSYFKQQKLDKYFLHGLGHGVGLEIHEMPFLRANPKSGHNLVENMVFSVEPGLYFESWGGIRIEDLAVIEKGKAKVLGKLADGIIEI